VAIAVALVAAFGGTVVLGMVTDERHRHRASDGVGPYRPDLTDPANPRNADSHWHTALGVYDCDRWLDDGTGKGLWQWPAITPAGGPGLAYNPRVYAGLHSHADGVIHMEPDSPADAGSNATLGRYFESGGWSVSQDGFDFLGVQRAHGEQCGNEPATIRWWVNGEEQQGDPAAYKLFDEDIVVVAFLTADAPPPGAPPSLPKAPWLPESQTA
jgi:hypothetical protein